jgi:hypothetical protein
MSVWISDACAVVEVNLSDNVWRSSAPPGQLATLLRITRDTCVLINRPVPVVGLLRFRKPLQDGSEEELRTLVEDWSANQDWNRGDFVLDFAESDERAETLARIWLGDNEVGAFSSSQLSCVQTDDEYVARLQKLVEEHMETLQPDLSRSDTGMGVPFPKDAVFSVSKGQNAITEDFNKWVDTVKKVAEGKARSETMEKDDD